MIFGNNAILRGLLIKHGRESIAGMASYELDDGDFERVLGDVRQQHSSYSEVEARAQAAFRLLTRAPAKVRTGGGDTRSFGIPGGPGEGATDALREEIGKFARAVGELASEVRLARIALVGIGLLLVLLLGAMGLKAAPGPDTGKAHTGETPVPHNLAATHPNLLAQEIPGLIVQFQNAGTTIGTYPAFLRINCSTNLTCTASGTTVTMTASSSAGSAFSAITTGTNTSATMTVGTGATLTFSGSGVINASECNGAACASGVTLQTNGANNASQATLNLLNSAATNGFTLTHTNTSGGNVQLGLSGILTVPGGGTGLGTLTAHDLYVGAGTANPNPVATGNAGQVLISNGAAADPTFQDPVVSYSYVNLLNAAAATATASSAAPVRISTFGGFGTLYVSYAGITGSPAGCTLQLKNADSLGNLINNGAAISTAPANGTTTSAVNSAAGLQTSAQMSVTYACTTYPAAGTVSVDYVPGLGVGIVNTPSVAQNGTWTVQQGSPPWSVSQSGAWTVQPGNTANTTPWLATINQGGNSATVTASNALKVDGSAVTQPVSGTVTANVGTTNGLALDATVAKLNNAQGSTTGGQTGPLAQGAVTTSAPSYTTAQTSPLSLTTAGALRTDSSATTQPVSGTVTANAGSGTFNIQANASVNVNQVAGSGVATAATGVQKVGVVGNGGTALDSAAGTANGQAVTVQGNASGIAVPVSGTVTANAGTGTFNIQANASVNLAQVAGSSTATSGTGIQKVGVTGNAGAAMDTAGQNAASPANELLVGAQFNTTPTTITSGNTSPLQVDNSGKLLVNCTGCSASSTVTANQGTAAAGTAGWPVVGGNVAETTAAWTSGTAVNTALTLTVTNYGEAMVFLNQGSTITAGAVTFEGSDTTGFTNAYAVQCSQFNSIATAGTYTLVASTNQGFACNVSGLVAFRVRLSTAITGTGTVNVGITAGSAPASRHATVAGTVTANAGTGNFGENLAQINGSAVSTAAAGVQKVGVVGNGGAALDSAAGTANGQAVTIQGNASGIAVPVSGTVTANAGTGNFNVVGTQATNSAVGNALEVLNGRFDTALPTLTSGNAALAELDSSGRVLVGSIAGALPAGTNVIGALSANQSVNEAQIGGTAVVADPCQAVAKSFQVINITANTQEITGTASKKTYICSINIVAGGADNVALVEGTGTVCATGIAGMAGGTTAATGWNFAANGGLTEGNGLGSLMVTATAADNVCLLVSGTAQVSGTIAYVQQ